MPDSPLIDLAVRRQVLLERIKSGQIKDFRKTFTEIQGIVRSVFMRLEGNLTDVNKRQLNQLLSQLSKDVKTAFAGQFKLYSAELEETAGVFAAADAFDITKSVSGITSLKIPETATLFSKAMNRPMSHSGEMVKDFINTFADRKTAQVTNTIRQGYIQGRTNKEMINSVIGTVARNRKDGVLAEVERHAQTVVRTTTQHVASSARHEMYKANPDVVEKYQWVSTLDSVTSKICRSLDGQVYKEGKGPIPPIHLNCRSTTIPVLGKEWDFLTKGRTRSAEFGPVSAKESYYDWIKAQDEKFQVQALGRDRAKLFRGGGLSNEKFRALQLDKNFRPLTLKEMKGLEPGAFKAAGVLQGG